MIFVLDDELLSNLDWLADLDFPAAGVLKKRLVKMRSAERETVAGERQRLTDRLVDDIADTMLNDDGYRRSYIRDRLESMSLDGVRQTYREIFGSLADELDDDLDDECAEGIHSWINETGKLPPNTACTRCGELYGNPD